MKKKKDLINELIRAQAKIEECNRFKMAFLANITHEIRTPLNGILGFLELLKELDPDNASRQEYINLVNQSSVRLLETIDDLILLSKIESGDHNLNISIVDLHEIMSTCKHYLNNDTNKNELQFYITSELTANDALVLTDRFKLESILKHLIQTIIVYNKQGIVEFGNYELNEQLNFYISSGTTDMPIKDFEYFFSGQTGKSGDNSSFFGCTWLGLSIAKSLAEDLKGSITVITNPTGVCTFTLSIPYVPAIITNNQTIKPIDQSDYQEMSKQA